MKEAVPFDIELWSKGWTPITRDGRKVEGLEKLNLGIYDLWYNFPMRGHLEQPYRWTIKGKGYWEKDCEHDLFLLPPNAQQ